MIRSRYFLASALFLLGVTTLTWFLLRTDTAQQTLRIGNLKEESPSQDERPHPKYKPTPTYVPPPVKDPFPALATSTPPPIPSYNQPEKYAWKKYNLEVAPPLLVGFTRSWPMLLQTVVSYITAGGSPSVPSVVKESITQSYIVAFFFAPATSIAMANIRVVLQDGRLNRSTWWRIRACNRPTRGDSSRCSTPST